MDEIWNLRGVDLFHHLTQEEIQEILISMPMYEYSTGQYLFHTGEPADSLYLLEAGIVKVAYITPNGEEKILGIFQQGDIFGELFLGKEHARIGEAQALSDVTVCRLKKEDFLMLLQRFPKVGYNFILHLVNEQRGTLARMHALMRTDARSRLLGTLLHIARRYCGDEEGWFDLPPSLTQEDIANMAGLNRSTVSLLINDLRREGALGGTGRTLNIHIGRVEKLLADNGLEMLR